MNSPDQMLTKKLRIKDKPGTIQVAEMRHNFERLVNETQQFQGRTPLDIVEINGQFSHYLNAETDILWIGFALGMRCAERISNAALNLGRPTFPPAHPLTRSPTCPP